MVNCTNLILNLKTGMLGQVKQSAPITVRMSLNKIGLLEGIDCKEVDVNEGHIF